MAKTMAHLSINTNAEDVAKGTDLVIEAIVENVDIKRKLFSSLDSVAPE